MKGTTVKVISQDGELLNFLVSLTKDGLSLIKNVLTPSAKSVWIISVSNWYSYSKENLWIGDDYPNNLKQRNG